MAWFGGFTLETYNRIPGDYEEVTVGVSAVGFSQFENYADHGTLCAHGRPGDPGVLGKRRHPVSD